MAKKTETAKVTKVSNEVTAIQNNLKDASVKIGVALIAAKSIKNCPKNIASRLTNLANSIAKTEANIVKRLSNVDAVAERKAKRLAGMVARAAKLQEQIKAAQA